MARKRSSLLRLAFRKPSFWQGHGFSWAEGHYRLRDCGEYLLKYHLNPGEIEMIPIKSVTLEDLGLERLPSGKIVPK